LGSVGFVPTMGNLHVGHASLIDRARAETATVVVSIFVNPLQFAPHEDFQRYPQTRTNDLQLCAKLGVDVVFTPDPQSLGLTAQAGLDTDRFLVSPPSSLVQGLCARSRPTHFAGVTTIVTKLLNIVQPDRAYFGQKDAQQLAILQAMVEQLNVPVTLCPCPIVREASGLACSSRNQYLSDIERTQAAVIYQALQAAQALAQAGVVDGAALIDAAAQVCHQVTALNVEYIELVDPQSLQPLLNLQSNPKTTGLLAIAARLGQTRLIDNLLITAVNYRCGESKA